MLTKEIKLGITETIAILKFANKDEIKKIPKKFMNFLNENEDKEYKFEINNEKSLKELKIRKETKNLLVMIAYNYWSETSEEKLQIEKLLKNNQEIYEQDLRAKYNPDNLFNKKSKMNRNETMELVEYKENIFKKIYKFFKRKFNK